MSFDERATTFTGHYGEMLNVHIVEAAVAVTRAAVLAGGSSRREDGKEHEELHV